MKTPRFIGLILLLALVVAARCWTWSDVFFGGEVFFLDPDCYSRMTRVAKVVADPGTIIGSHDFENWPKGVMPHTTAPMDYAVAVGAWILALFTEKARAISLAGAWVPVVLGLGTALFLWRWAREATWSASRWIVLFFFAISPMLVQATVLGRPDHQALVVPLVIVALGAEVALLAGWGRGARWGLLAGAAWGSALWVSLYEPGILLIATLLLLAGLHPRALISRERRWGWLLMVAILGFALAVEGVKSPLPEREVLEAFPAWAATIGELASLPPWSSVLFRWTSFFYLGAFFILPWVAWKQRDQARPALFLCGMLLITVVLTCWQVRWGYFLSAVYLLSIPWQLRVIPAKWAKHRWLPAAITITAIAPVVNEWDERFFQDESPVAIQRLQQRREQVALRDLSLRIAAQPDPGAILAPWWQSPALAYWTGLPCVAGSSHQSLPGTLDTARFYVSTDPAAALALAKERLVTFVVVYEPQNLLLNSAMILGDTSLPENEARTMAGWLFRRPNSPPPGFQLLGGNPYFRFFRVDAERISGLETPAGPASVSEK